MDEGIQIDVSNKQSENANESRMEMQQPSPNLRPDKARQSEKQPASMRSIRLGILTTPAQPKYRIADVSPMFVRQPSVTFRNSFSGSIEMFSISLIPSHKPFS
jgi:hypothetical protein